MLGSIIGDIVGSIYEFDNIKTKEFPFFNDIKEYTDDSILTIATAEWLLDGCEKSAGTYYLRYAQTYPYPMGSYGTGFSSWVARASRGEVAPYDSCGNGSAMRVGPVGWAFDTEAEVLDAARRSAEVTHNHPEGIKGAQATALCVFMARTGTTKKQIRERVTELFGYDLHFSCDDIRSTYGWGATCQDTVPQAIVAFLDGTDFEDCVRNAISIGGDSDTLGCITGSIAEAFYPIDGKVAHEALHRLPQPLKQVVQDFETRFGHN